MKAPFYTNLYPRLTFAQKKSLGIQLMDQRI